METLDNTAKLDLIRATLNELAHDVNGHEGTVEFGKLLDSLTHTVGQQFGVVVPERQPRRAKLSWPKVDEIRARYAAGEKVQVLAEDYGVTYANVSRIVNNQLWTKRR